jgi:hypothetical protein
MHKHMQMRTHKHTHAQTYTSQTSYVPQFRSQCMVSVLAENVPSLSATWSEH